MFREWISDSYHILPVRKNYKNHHYRGTSDSDICSVSDISECFCRLLEACDKCFSYHNRVEKRKSTSGNSYAFYCNLHIITDQLSVGEKGRSKIEGRMPLCFIHNIPHNLQIHSLVVSDDLLYIVLPSVWPGSWSSLLSENIYFHPPV